MWIINFLIYASVLLISILLTYLVISFFPRAKRQINFFDKKTPLYEKTAFYISNLVSIASLIISLRTYNDSLQASVNQNKVNDSTRTALERVVKLIAIQTKTLNSSKASLQSVVELTRKQQKILDANLAVSKEQYKNIRERNDQDRKIAAYKPDLQIEISLFGMFYTAKDFVKDSGNDWLKLSLEKSFLNGKIPASVRL